jgi:GNAT superfamily N-acetyltransferase
MNKAATTYRIEQLDGAAAFAAVPALAEILIDCVEGGASVSFMWPLWRDKAETFWRKCASAVASGDHVLFVARTDDCIEGTVQVVLSLPENQPHRAELTKMLVHRRGRRHGIAEALLDAAERAARNAGKSLLVLDTMTGTDAERLYLRTGWTLAGRIPDYALFPDGRPGPTSIFFKPL